MLTDLDCKNLLVKAGFYSDLDSIPDNVWIESGYCEELNPFETLRDEYASIVQLNAHYYAIMRVEEVEQDNIGRSYTQVNYLFARSLGSWEKDSLAIQAIDLAWDTAKGRCSESLSAVAARLEEIKKRLKILGVICNFENFRQLRFELVSTACI